MLNAMDVFKKFYSELTTVLPMIINKLVTKFYADQLLSNDHKDNIDSLTTGKEKTQYFLDKVIKPSLEIKYTKQFDEMLRLMKSSDDCAINHVADEIEKFMGVGETQLVQGNYQLDTCRLMLLIILDFTQNPVAVAKYAAS